MITSAKIPFLIRPYSQVPRMGPMHLSAGHSSTCNSFLDDKHWIVGDFLGSRPWEGRSVVLGCMLGVYQHRERRRGEGRLGEKSGSLGP